MLLFVYYRSPYREFETFRRLAVAFDEEDIQLILRQCQSHFVTYEISPGLYTIEDIAEAVYTKGDHERTMEVENDDISMKTKLIFNSLWIMVWRGKI